MSDLIVPILVIVVTAYFIFRSKKKNKTKIPDEALDATHTVIKLMDIQKRIILVNDSLPKRATDPYALGYISGMIDASLSCLGIEDIKTAMGAISFTYQKVYGEKNADSLTQKSLGYIKNENSDFNQGLKEGGKEFLKFTYEDNYRPVKWMGYVNNYESLKSI